MKNSFLEFIENHKKPTSIILLSFLVLVFLIFLMWIGYTVSWTGFSGKTLVDWLELIIIPAVLTVGALLFNRAQRTSELFIVNDQNRESALQGYLDKMTELLLEKGLRNSISGDEVRNVARTRALTTLRNLDENRKVILLRFLYEADLMNKPEPIVELRGADLTGANLNGAVFINGYFHAVNFSSTSCREAWFSSADLDRANFTTAELMGADFRGAHLLATNFEGADLRGANFRGAEMLTKKQINTAITDETTLLDENLPLDEEEAWAIVYYRWGKDMLIEGDYINAEGNLSQAINGGQDNPDTYFLRGLARLQLRNYAKAEEDFSAAVAKGRIDAAVYQARAIAYIYLEQLKLAQYDCVQAENLAPDDPTTHSCWGTWHMASGEYNHAIKRFQLAFERGSDSALYLDLGLSLLLSGKFEESKEAYQNGLAQGQAITIKEALYDLDLWPIRRAENMTTAKAKETISTIREWLETALK